MSELTNGSRVSESKGNFEEISIPVPWGHISGKWWGPRDIQPVLAIHGWQDNSGTFDNLAPLLVKSDVAVFCIDLPGHGNSSHYGPGQFYYIFWDGFLVTRRIVKHFNWSNISILGHSLGGAIAFLYASIFPNDISKYISIDISSPSVRSVSRMLKLSSGAVDKYLQYEMMNSDSVPCYEYKDMIDLVEDAHGGSCTRQSCEILMRRGMKSIGDNKYVFARDPRLKVSSLAFVSEDQVLEMAKKIVCKVMNIRGSPGMKFENEEFYSVVLDEIEHTAAVLERHVIPGTHHLHLNNAESITGIITEFLRK